MFAIFLTIFMHTHMHIHIHTQIKKSEIESTMSSLYKDSHIPCKLGVHVPVTTNLSVKTGAPIRSIPERKGLLSASSPATTGSQNQGENLLKSKN